MSDRVHIFNAGPAGLPLEVLKKAQEGMLNYQGSGMSVMEMSHRSKVYDEIHNHAIQNIRSLYSISDDYEVLFLQGGASTQFSMVPMNLASKDSTIDIIQTGSWTQKASKEIKKVCQLHEAASSKEHNYAQIPDQSELKFSENPAYVHIATNNTIAGTQYKDIPDVGDRLLVADMSSDILSCQRDISRFAIIFAGAQKNLGPSGVTVVIIRKDLIDKGPESLPSMLQYRSHAKANSLYNTPPTFGIHLIALVTDYIQEKGGLTAMQKTNEAKAAKLYQAIDSLAIYYCPVREKDRSKMNVVFRVRPDGENADEEIEAKFVKEATAAGLEGLKGHRSVGGLRASIYNACPQESIEALTQFMEAFARENKK